MINKLEQIAHLLKETKVHVLSINESWLNENNYMKIKKNNFNFIGKNRNTREGGVGFLIKKIFTYEEIDFQYNFSTFEHLIIEAHIENCKISIITIYKLIHSNNNIFIDELHKLISKIYKPNKKVIITGDFNIDLLNMNSSLVKDFENSIITYDLKATINKPTRMPSRSLLNNIITTMEITSSFIMTDDISDYLPIFTSINIKQIIVNKNCINKIKRYYNENNIKRFCNILKETEWHEIIEKNNIKNSYKNDISLLVKNFIAYYKILFNQYVTDKKTALQTKMSQRKLG